VTAALLGLVAAEPSKARPVAKIVAMLEDMKDQLEKEADADKAMEDKWFCWHKTNSDDKKANINSGSARSKELVSSIASLKAAIEQYTTEIEEQHQAYVAASQNLQSLSDRRMKESKEFGERNADKLTMIKSLGAAVTVLDKTGDVSMVDIGAVLRQAGASPQLRADSARAQRLLTSYLQQPAGYKSYNRGSGQIVGILKQMKDRAEADIAEDQKKEDDAKAAYKIQADSLKNAMKNAKETRSRKQTQNAEAKANLAADKEELTNVDAALAHDVEALAGIEEAGKTNLKMMDERKAERANEIKAILEAIKILNSEDAFESFDKTVNTKAIDFIQMGIRTRRQTTRERAMAALTEVSTNPEVAALQLKIKLDAFTKVKEAIDQMSTELKAQQKDEVEFRDVCIAEDNTNKEETSLHEAEHGRVAADIESLQKQLEQIKVDIEEATTAKANAEKAIQSASNTRKAESNEYHTVVADQHATQQVLFKAIQRLKEFYDPEVKIAGYHDDALVQAPGDKVPEAPKAIKNYSKNAGGNRVLSMLDTVMADSKELEATATREEEESQNLYVKFVQSSNQEINLLTKSLAALAENQASTDEKLNLRKDSLAAEDKELANLNEMAIAINKKCTFVIRNFEKRQAARVQEMEALSQAKAILSGA